VLTGQRGPSPEPPERADSDEGSVELLCELSRRGQKQKCVPLLSPKRAGRGLSRAQGSLPPSSRSAPRKFIGPTTA